MPTDSNSNPFLDTLIALRDRYLTLATPSAQQAGFAREQLNHINALLVDQMLEPGTATIASPAELSIAPPDVPALLSSSAPSAIADKSKPVAKAQPKPTAASKRQTKVAPAPKPATPSAREPGKNQRDTVLPLLDAYTGLSKTQAVAKVMADHAGQVLSLDELITALHGELDNAALKQERKRMRTIMWRGVDSQKWQRVKGKDSHYTLPAKLLPAKSGRSPRPPKPAATPNTAKTRKGAAAKSTIAGSLMGAIEQVLQDNRGTPLRAEAIATAIFGELSPVRLAEVKKDIADRLAKGAKARRWQRVPKRLGVYVYL